MLSIIIPTLNEEQYLPRLLASIAGQRGTDFEITVADAGSTDATVRIAEVAGARVVAGGLPGAGRNSGAAVSIGETLLFLDADVVLPSRTFLGDCMKEFDARALAIASCEIDPLTDERLDRFMHWVYNVYTVSTEKIVPHAGGFFILVRRAVHEAIGGFDETVRFAEDQEYVQRAVAVGPYGFLRCHKIAVSVRRFERDGRFTVAAKNLIAELHMRTIGPIRSDILKYRFGYDRDRDTHA